MIDDSSHELTSVFGASIGAIPVISAAGYAIQWFIRDGSSNALEHWKTDEHMY